MPRVNQPSRLGSVVPGLYRHYKGGLYRVLCSVRHTETGETFVVYRAYRGRQTWVRPYEMFNETVRVNGVSKRRFEPVDRSGASRSIRMDQQLELFAS